MPMTRRLSRMLACGAGRKSRRLLHLPGKLLPGIFPRHGIAQLNHRILKIVDPNGLIALLAVNQLRDQCLQPLWFE